MHYADTYSAPHNKFTKKSKKSKIIYICSHQFEKHVLFALRLTLMVSWLFEVEIAENLQNA